MGTHQANVLLRMTRKYKAASFPAAVSNLKFAMPQEGASLKFLFTTLASPDGTIYNPATAPKRYTTGRVYTSLFVRHWDAYIKPERSVIFSGALSLNEEGGQYTAASTHYTNLLEDSKLESPVAPFGDAGDFDITKDGTLVAFLAKDPDLNPANNTASYIYLVPASGETPPKPLNKPKNKDDPAGASSSPAFSPDGKRLAFLQMDMNGYESDKRKIYLADVETGDIAVLIPDWDRSPSKVTWSKNGNYLYLIGEEYGRDKVWLLPSNPLAQAEPQILVEDGGASDLYSLGGQSKSSSELDTLLITSTSLASPTYYSVLEIKSRSVRTLFSPRAVSTSGSSSLRESQIGEFWAPRDKYRSIHGWIIKPSFFKESEKYPLAFFIHGGPQGAWTNSWSTRWNPAVFAERGFVVVTVNPTGSTGYGQAFTDAIRKNWGGQPYEDLVLAHDYVLKKYNFIDGDRAVALGASYGGYMINWIQGMPFGRKFKALVCHDGIFSTMNQYTSEELYFPEHDFGGPIWSHREEYEKWSPANHINNWATPQMVIHNDLDFRLPVSEGLAAFNILQSLGIPSKYLTFPDENHWVLNPENSLVWHREIMEFIEHWVGLDKDGVTQDVREESRAQGEVKGAEIVDQKENVEVKIGEGKKMMQEVFEKVERDM